MTDDLVLWLESWFATRCDGEWEHSEGITIETLDNPGWRIAFNVPDSVVRDFELVAWDRGEDDWLHSSFEGDLLIVACAVDRLRTGLELMRRWLSAPRS